MNDETFLVYLIKIKLFTVVSGRSYPWNIGQRGNPRGNPHPDLVSSAASVDDIA